MHFSYSQIVCPSQSSHVPFLCTKTDLATHSPYLPCPFPDRAEITLPKDNPDFPVCCVVTQVFSTQNTWDSVSTYSRKFFIQIHMIKLFSSATSREETGCWDNSICPRNIYCIFFLLAVYVRNSDLCYPYYPLFWRGF